MENPIWTYIFGPPKERKAMIELLRSLPAFDGLTTNELLQVERMLHVRRFTAGEQVFSEGLPGVGMYIVKEGEIEITKKIGNGGSVRLTLVGERHFFGEMALLDEMPRSASGSATRDSVLLSLCKPDLEQISERNPALANKIIGNLARLICRRLVKANENLETLQAKLEEAKAASRGKKAAGDE